MSQPTDQRPPQVTMAAGVILFSSVLVLLTAWERLSTIRSLDTRKAIEAILADPPASGMGLGIERAIQLVYVAGVIAALCATATAILGWYVLKPDTGARRALTILAVPLFITGLAAGGFAASFVAAGAAMLWMQPAREWFATGRWTPPSPVPSSPVSSTTPMSTTPISTTPISATPISTVGGTPLPHQMQPLALHQRPRALVAAFVLTVVMAGGVLVLSLLSLVLVGLSPDMIMSELERQRPELVQDGLTMAQMRFSTYISAAGTVLWCGAALAFAGFAMARRSWAWRGLVITAAFSAGACLMIAFAAPVLAIPAAAGVATVVCLRRPEVRRWFAPRSR